MKEAKLALDTQCRAPEMEAEDVYYSLENNFPIVLPKSKPEAVQVHIFCWSILTCLANISDLCFSSFSYKDSFPKRRLPNPFLESSLIPYSLPSKQTITVHSWLVVLRAVGCRLCRCWRHSITTCHHSPGNCTFAFTLQ